ncbi:hypothetical protein Tco_1122613 [Tanacetum coccineum]|uniref:Uncharacterized protein n=1 Tax=Tanacetum coccineum TaxID=301880 RepID=A0ABQ5J3Z8_9ASTR
MPVVASAQKNKGTLAALSIVRAASNKILTRSPSPRIGAFDHFHNFSFQKLSTNLVSSLLDFRSVGLEAPESTYMNKGSLRAAIELEDNGVLDTVEHLGVLCSKILAVLDAFPRGILTFGLVLILLGLPLLVLIGNSLGLSSP